MRKYDAKIDNDFVKKLNELEEEGRIDEIVYGFIVFSDGAKKYSSSLKNEFNGFQSEIISEKVASFTSPAKHVESIALNDYVSSIKLHATDILDVIWNPKKEKDKQKKLWDLSSEN